MTLDRTAKILLAIIAALLFAMVLRPFMTPHGVEAQSGERYDFYIEPGTYMLRSAGGDYQVLGKVMVDMRTGDIWGYPTADAGPYPVDVAKSAPPVSKPIYLGRFDFAAAKRNM
jgi:hypothetical protein